ncbi:universal stress protein [Mesorhizobium sp. BR1-1-6]|uniref:universal stress protein n=1 Tax=unclassified Mesorhizobium TaxID=325217 RepID=UPI00112BBACD|nr:MULTISPECIES: universal stress protein [unclassified Mesorhizobium]MBZ9898402.1 universal stress protein [Mesorhizobium sp. BR1-1-6]MCA0056569.1 universal stress protein [Mesorhizobium sp. B261B1A]TPL02668.1 universal stress protein [Mesorhizobium sp. B2-4-11]TPL97278.1 universal stress protein [Mesorhizobium sp. B2-3-8]TPM14479.1 universal stress protein [Mesorhizobium sp. B2-3-7]
MTFSPWPSRHRRSLARGRLFWQFSSFHPPGSLILQAGRPVFVASTSQENFRINKILVGWKDRREAKRAVTDAVPLFQMAQEAGIITIEDAATDETWNSLNNIVAFLSSHGVRAKADVFPERSDGGSIADVADAMHADLTISGAYGQQVQGVDLWRCYPLAA